MHVYMYRIFCAVESSQRLWHMATPHESQTILPKFCLIGRSVA